MRGLKGGGGAMGGLLGGKGFERMGDGRLERRCVVWEGRDGRTYRSESDSWGPVDMRSSSESSESAQKHTLAAASSEAPTSYGSRAQNLRAGALVCLTCVCEIGGVVCGVGDWTWLRLVELLVFDFF